MADNELLLAISDLMDRKLQPIKEDIQGLKEDVQVLKEGFHDLKEDVQVLKEGFHDLKEDVQVLKEGFHDLKEEVQTLKEDVHGLKEEVQTLKEDVQTLKEDVQTLKEDVQNLQLRTTKIELMLENETNHNIQLLAENHINLVDKLNQALRVSDKTLLYEVQVSALKLKLERLETEVAEIKNKIA